MPKRLGLALSVVISAAILAGFAATAQNTWTNGAPMLTPRFGAAFGLIKGKVYVVGGATASAIVGTNEIYDPVKNKWTTGASMPTPSFAPATAVVNIPITPVTGHLGDSAQHDD